MKSHFTMTKLRDLVGEGGRAFPGIEPLQRGILGDFGGGEAGGFGCRGHGGRTTLLLSSDKK
jgi:hypothetical protein